MNAIFIIGKNSSEHFKQTLRQLGYAYTVLPSNQKTYEPVNDHPDLYGTPFPNELVLLEPTLYEKLISEGVKLDPKRHIKGEKPLGEKYPETCIYNYLAFSGLLIGNKSYCIPQVIMVTKKSLLEVCHVNQAYVRCTTFAIGERHMITSDEGIYKVLKRCLADKNVSLLYVDPKSICLEGFKHGFFGGCAVALEPALFYFNGNLEAHPQSAQITAFLKAAGVNWIHNPNMPLTDMGSALKLIL